MRVIFSNPKRVTALAVVMVTTAAAVYALSEGKSFVDGLWWAVVTATTVGYGDSFPTHLSGRICAVSLMVSMVLIVIPAITAHMASRLIVDADAFTHAEQEEIKQLLREIHQATTDTEVSRDV